LVGGLHRKLCSKVILQFIENAFDETLYQGGTFFIEIMWDESFIKQNVLETKLILVRLDSLQ